MPLKSTGRSELQGLFMERVNELLLNNDSLVLDLMFVTRRILRATEESTYGTSQEIWKSPDEFRAWAGNPENHTLLNDVFDTIVTASDVLSGWLFEQINGVRLMPEKQFVKPSVSNATEVDRRAERELLEGKTALLAEMLRQADKEALVKRYAVLSEHVHREDNQEETRDTKQRAMLAEHLRQEAARTRPTQPPAWLATIQPQNPPTDGTNGMHRVIGKWPGDETDAEIEEALARLS